jgi:hypothetical protein
MRLVFNIAGIAIIVWLMIRWFAKYLAQKDYHERHTLVALFASAIFLKLAVVIIWYSIVGHNFDKIWQDTYYYDWGGKYLSMHFRNFTFYKPAFSNLFGSFGGYYYVGIVYTIFGHYPLMVSITNILLSVAIAVFMFKVAENIFGRKAARWTLIFNLFYPYYISISYYLLRDIIIALTVTAAAWFLIKNKQRKSTYCFLVVFLLMLYFLRPPLAAMFLGLCAVHMLFNYHAGGSRVFKTMFIGGVTVLMIVGFCGIVQMPGRTAFEKIANTHIEDVESSSAYSEDVRGMTGAVQLVKAYPKSFIKHAVPTFIMTFWGPFHFCARSQAALFHKYGRFIFWENLRSIFMFVLMPMVLYGLYHCWKKKLKEAFIFHAFVVLMTMVLMFTGNEIRWGLSMMPFVLMFGAVGLVHFESVKVLYVPYMLLVNVVAVCNLTYSNNMIFAAPLTVLTLTGGLIVLLRYRKTSYGHTK